MSEAAIVLCGGSSRRMGRDKWSLPFLGETLLERTVRTVREVVDEVWVVAREGQEIDDGDYRIVRDPAEGLGPLAGLVAGLEAMSAERAFLTSCDVPFLKAAYVRRMLERSRGHPVAVPLLDGYHMSTSAVYGKDVLPVARRLLREERLRPLFLIREVDALIVNETALRDMDSELASFRDCNTPEAYEQALRDAELS
jgi:molybdopterin-guanine dinucleotide biosynthesis protein A